MTTEITEDIRRFIDGLMTRPVKKRMIEYVIREVRSGRDLMDVIRDPYIKNTLNEGQVSSVLIENPEVIDAVEKQIRSGYPPEPE